jgi:choline dehydrogenase-like flavoprotein
MGTQVASKMLNVCVIGSGPSGVSAAHSLLQAGARVTMMDLGRRLEPRMAEWSRQSEERPGEEFLAAVHARRRDARKEMDFLPDKLPFGSTFAYQEHPRTRLDFSGKARFVSSLALGGLSNAWGANIARTAQKDIEDWPIRAEELDTYIDRLRCFLPVSGEEDAVDSLFGAPLAGECNYQMSPQGEYVLGTAQEHSAELREQGLLLGRAKLAIGKHNASHPDGCIGCGLCMHGCPYGAIFNSADVVQNELSSQSSFSYRDGVIVERFVEHEGSVELGFLDERSGANETARFDRVYLALGAVGSTALVARSLNWTDHTFQIHDSQKYIFGFFQNRRTRGAIRDRRSELSQIYIETDRLESSSRIAHGQLYGYNDLLLDPFRRRLGEGFASMLPALGGWLLERFMIGFLYLHSDVSGHMDFDVAPLGEATGAEPGLGRIRGVSNPASIPVKNEFFALLRRNKRRIGGAPSRWLVLSNLPGNSQHFGASLPMRNDPEPHCTDVLGRPHGCRRVHVVDCSVLPSITGTPPTLTAMANAARIGDLSLRA